MTPSNRKKIPALTVVQPARTEEELEHTPLQVCLEQGLSDDAVAERVLTTRQFRTFLNIRMRQLALREQELEAA
jgi:hypothetical protein